MPAFSTFRHITGSWNLDTLSLAFRIRDTWKTPFDRALSTAKQEIAAVRTLMAEAGSARDVAQELRTLRERCYRLEYYDRPARFHDAIDNATQRLLAAQLRDRLLASGLLLHEIIPTCERRDGYTPPLWQLTPQTSGEYA